MLGSLGVGEESLSLEPTFLVYYRLRFASAICLIEDPYCALPRRDSVYFISWLRFISRIGYVLSKVLHCDLLLAFCLPLKTYIAFWWKETLAKFLLLCVLTDYESWSQRIRLYYRGKENGLCILQSIDQGPFELGTTRNTLGTTPEGGVLLGPERPCTYDDLSDNEKKRYDADVRATNIVLQGLPKDIYKLINHNIEAKAIWDNVKMLLACSELTKEDRESQLYDEFEQFKMLPGENINEYCVRFHKLVNDMRNIRMTMPNNQLNSKATLPQTNNQLQTSSNTRNQATVQDGRIVVQNVQGRHNQNQNQRYLARGNGVAGNRGVQNRAGNANAAQENGAVLDEEELLFLAASVDMGNSNVIPYEQYLSVNNVSVVPSCASSALNYACVLFNNDAYVPHDPISTELKIYKEHIAIYEQCAKFELTEREQTIDDKMRMPIQNRNKMEENIKKELHSVKLQLNSTMENNKIIEETVTVLKQEFKQKENKFLTDFSNLKHLNDKLEKKLHTQDQSIQTVHMMLNPTMVYDQKTKTTIGAQNPFYLRQAKKAQLALYDGEELLKTHHVSVIVPSSEEDLELVEVTRNKMHAKINDSACVEKRAEELKANAPPLPVLLPATVYPPNTPVHLVPRTLPTTSQVNIGLYVITQLFWDFEKTCKKRITPTGITEGERGFEKTKWCYLTEVIPFFNLLKEHFNGIQKSLVTKVRAMKAVFENLEAEVDQNEIDLKSSEIEQKNLLIANENLIAECLSKDVFYTATDSMLNVSRFFDTHDAFTTAQKRFIANLI
ncbi:hypothetical protein Tco_1301666 [Tanacetum coccineum]